MAEIRADAGRAPDLSVWQRFEVSRMAIAFQPIVALGTGTIFGYEALARPLDRQGRTMAPGALFQRALVSGDAEALDRLVLETVFREGSRQHVPHLLFANVLPSSLTPVLGFLETQTIFPASAVVLELVESAAGTSDVQGALHRLRRVGYRIALDDVGEGYSNLNRIVETSPDFAKVDIGLVRGVDQNQPKYSLVDAVARFARRSGVSLIAEGVETAAELAAIRELGVEMAQGYYLGKPRRRVQRRLSVPYAPGGPSPAEDPTRTAAALVRLLRHAGRGMGQGTAQADALALLTTQAANADLAVLLRRGPDGTVVVEAQHGLAAPAHLSPVQQKRLAEQAATLEPLVIQEPDDRLLRPRDQAGSLIALPILAHDRCWGHVIVGFNAPQQVRPATVDLISGLAGLFGLLLTADPTAADLTLSSQGLLEAARGLVSDEVDLPRLLQHILRAALTVTGGHAGFIGLIGEEGLTAVDADGAPFVIPLEQLRDPTSGDGRSTNGEAFRTKRPAFVDDVRVDARVEPWRAAMLAEGILSAAAVPLLAEQQVLGLLKVYHGAVNAFRDTARRQRLEGLAGLGSALLAREKAAAAQRMGAERRQKILDSYARILHESDPVAAARQVAEAAVGMARARLSVMTGPMSDEPLHILAQAGPAQPYLDEVADDSAENPVRLLAGMRRRVEPLWLTAETSGLERLRERVSWTTIKRWGFRWFGAIPLEAYGQPVGLLAVWGGETALDPGLQRSLLQLGRTAAMVAYSVKAQERTNELGSSLRLLHQAVPQLAAAKPGRRTSVLLDLVVEHAPHLWAAWARVEDGRVVLAPRRAASPLAAVAQMRGIRGDRLADAIREGRAYQRSVAAPETRLTQAGIGYYAVFPSGLPGRSLLIGTARNLLGESDRQTLATLAMLPVLLRDGLIDQRQHILH